jgi:C4-type Zn-finger protein
MVTIFMKCPSCGKRFEVHKTGEAVVDKEEEIVVVREPQTAMTEEMPRNSFDAGALPPESLIPPPKTVPVAAEKTVVEETYKCTHCGYTWTEDKETLKNEHGGEIRGEVVSEGPP